MREIFTFLNFGGKKRDIEVSKIFNFGNLKIAQDVAAPSRAKDGASCLGGCLLPHGLDDGLLLLPLPLSKVVGTILYGPNLFCAYFRR